MEFEDILAEVGNWGRFQKVLLFVFGVSLSIAASFPGFAVIFMVIAPDHHCFLPVILKNTSDVDNKTSQFESTSSCHISEFSTILVNGSFSNRTTVTSCPYGWQYDETYFDSTVATKWDMVCDNSHYPSLIITLQNVGSLLATPFYGALADRFGRKMLCFSMLLLSSLTDLISIFIDNFIIFAIIRTINGSVLPAIFNFSYILISEFMAPEKRVMVNGVFNIFWMTGMCCIPLVAYLVRTWSLLAAASSLFVSCVLLNFKFVPESASWLLSQEKYEDAANVLMLIAERNKKTPKKEQILFQLKEFGEKAKKDQKKEDGQFFLYLIKNPRLRKHFLILTYNWMSNSVAYMCLQYNVVNLGGNIFLNFFLLSLVEFPGNILFWIMMEKLGRRWSATTGFLSTGICCLLPLTGLESSYLVSSIVGKLITSGMFMTTDQQGCELCPTSARTLAMATGKSIAMSAVLFTPFLAYLSIYGRSIPFVALSIMSFSAAILSSFLPETLNYNLPQTFTDAENFGKDQKYFSFNRKSNVIQQIKISTIGTQSTDQLVASRQSMTSVNFDQEKF